MNILAVFLICIATSAHGLKKVPKEVGKPVWAHFMPWFETRNTSDNGNWGIHWTMTNQNPDIVDGNGKRQIAAHYYPEIGPYASGDPDVIEYQLNLMRVAGIDGVLIDWPGTINWVDYPMNLNNSNKLINRTADFGLEFAVVYEDNNVNLAYQAGIISDKIGQGRLDLTYAEQNYFSRPNYVKMAPLNSTVTRPLLLDFGPLTFEQPNEWTQVFEALSQRPTFLTLWYESQEAGENANGEFSWIYFDFMDGLNWFYFNNTLDGIKMGGAYPGFHTFYSIGGWPGPEWQIEHNGLGTFAQTFDLVVNSPVPYIQLITWNDYGEGTMIEPTQEFGNGFLNIIQNTLGVPYGDRELNLCKDLYYARKEFEGKAEVQNQLDKVAASLLDLEFDSAEKQLHSIRHHLYRPSVL